MKAVGDHHNKESFRIQSEESLIYIRGGKGKKDRRVPLSPQILKELRRYYQSYQPKEYLFAGQKGGKYSHVSAAKVLKRATKRAGIDKRVTLHTLRHSYATHLTNRGINIQYLQEILGHKWPKSTMLYTHHSGKDIKPSWMKWIYEYIFLIMTNYMPIWNVRCIKCKNINEFRSMFRFALIDLTSTRLYHLLSWPLRGMNERNKIW